MPVPSSESRVRFILRELRPGDLPTVAEFECEIARISFAEEAVVDPAFHQRRLETALAEPKKNHMLVIEAEGTVAGWAWIAPRTNFVSQEVYADLRSFYVASPYRGTAVAPRLMRGCLEHCRSLGLRRVVGRTAAHNENMMALYEIHGFEAKHVTFEQVLSGVESERARPKREPGRVGGFRKSRRRSRPSS